MHWSFTGHRAPELEIFQLRPETQSLYSIFWSLADHSRVSTHHQADWFLEWFSISIDDENAGSLQKPEYSTNKFAIYSCLVYRVQSGVRKKGKMGMDPPEMQPKPRVIQSLMHVPYQAPPMPNNLNFQNRQLATEIDSCLDQVGNRWKKGNCKDASVSSY